MNTMPFSAYARKQELWHIQVTPEERAVLLQATRHDLDAISRQ